MISRIRHQEILPLDMCSNVPVTVIGCGATGSHLIMSLVELGFDRITVYDFDKVEAHNLANQAFNQNQIGWLKVDAMRELVAAKLGGIPEAMRFSPEAVTADTQLTGIVFLLTDTMASRREIANALENTSYVIETRMASSYGNVFGFYPRIHMPAWLDTLTNDEDAEVSACGTSISVGPTAKITANLAVWHLINFLNGAEDSTRTNFYLNPLMIGVEAI